MASFSAGCLVSGAADVAHFLRGGRANFEVTPQHRPRLSDQLTPFIVNDATHAGPTQQRAISMSEAAMVAAAGTRPVCGTWL